MTGHNNKKPGFDRNRAVGPWEPLAPAILTPELRAEGVQMVFRNNRFSVAVRQTESQGLLMQVDPKQPPQPTPILHLIVVGAGNRDPTYREKMAIKREIAGADCDMVEIYPDEERELPLPQTHLWCLPPKYRLPLGLWPEAMARRASMPDGIPGVITRAEMQLYVVETPQEGADSIVEVFATEADARDSYEQTGSPFPEGGGTERVFMACPAEEEGAAWSPAALARREDIMARITEAGRQMAAAQAEAEDQVRLPLGTPSVEEELEAGQAFGERGLIDGMLEPEEAERMATLMRAGVAQKAGDREAAMTEAERAAEAADEVAAADSLRRMREEMRHRGGSDGQPN